MQDPKSFFRMVVCFLFSLVISGSAQVVVNLATFGNAWWLAALQVAAAAGMIGYLVLAFHERGLVYTLVIALALAILLALLNKFIASWILRILLVFAFEVLLAGMILAGDYLGRSSRVLRMALGALFGIAASFLVTGIIGTAVGSIGGFWKGITTGIPVILELGITPPLALFLTRALLGEKTKKPPQEESV